MTCKFYYRVYQRWNEYRIAERPWWWPWWNWRESYTTTNLAHSLESLQQYRARNARDCQKWKPVDIELDEGI